MTTREQLEAEAEELYPIIAINGSRQGDAIRTAHIRAKTITADQVEAAAEAHYESFVPQMFNRGPWGDIKDTSFKVAYLERMRVALRAAGFLVEGDDDVSEA